MHSIAIARLHNIKLKMDFFSRATRTISQTWGGLTHTQQIATATALAVSSFWLWRKWIAGGVNKYHPDLTGKVVLVTGANTGIGLQTAKFLASLNAEVYLTVRDDVKGAASVKEVKRGHHNDKVYYFECELASLKSVRQFVENYKTRVNKKIDILIENAGVMVPPYTLTEDGFELQIGVNHLAHFLMANLLLKANLINENGGRVVVVSSMGHYGGRINYDDLNWTKSYSRWPAYFQSKLANVLFARELNKRMQAQGKDITAVSLHPGAVRTDLDRNFPGAARLVVDLFHRLFYKSALEGAQTSLHCALSPHIEGGAYYSDCAVKKPNKLVTDEEAFKLWEFSEKLVGLKQV